MVMSSGGGGGGGGGGMREFGGLGGGDAGDLLGFGPGEPPNSFSWSAKVLAFCSGARNLPGEDRGVKNAAASDLRHLVRWHAGDRTCAERLLEVLARSALSCRPSNRKGRPH